MSVPVGIFHFLWTCNPYLFDLFFWNSHFTHEGLFSTFFLAISICAVSQLDGNAPIVRSTTLADRGKRLSLRRRWIRVRQGCWESCEGEWRGHAGISIMFWLVYFLSFFFLFYKMFSGIFSEDCWRKSIFHKCRIWECWIIGQDIGVTVKTAAFTISSWLP